MHAILDEIDTNRNGQVELDEYLQVGTISCCFHDIFLIICFALFLADVRN